MLRMKYAALFVVLSVFSLMSLGSVRSSAQVATIRAMHTEDPATRDFLVWLDYEPDYSPFTERSLACAITNAQADTLEKTLPSRTRRYLMNGQSVRVVYLQANSESLPVLRRTVGNRLQDPRQAQVVEESRLIPLLTPTFVS